MLSEDMLAMVVAYCQRRAANNDEGVPLLATVGALAVTDSMLEEAVCKLFDRVVNLQDDAERLRDHYKALLDEPKHIRIACEMCHALHVDLGEYKTKPHKSHTCQNCGHTWMPALFHTVGVKFLPGTENPPEQQ